MVAISIENFDIEAIVKAGKADEMDDKQVLIDDRYIEIPSDPVEPNVDKSPVYVLQYWS